MTLPAERSLLRLQREAAGCQRCGLFEHATQTVFGDGSVQARIMMVGEQPGDVEDTEGAVFVGPAGKLLDRALLAAGLDRQELYLTNAVKHFKWTPQGKRRIHQNPNRGEVAACRPWLESEISIVEPELIVALGATAAKALLGPEVRVTRDRGAFVEIEGLGLVMPTVHPSSVLRAEGAARTVAFDALVADLELAAVRVGPARP